MTARQPLALNHVLVDMEGKLTNSKWAVIGKCSADTALRDINDLLARAVLRRLGRVLPHDAGGLHPRARPRMGAPP